MAPAPSPLRNLVRLVYLDLLWETRVPQSLLYQFFVSGVLLLVLLQINPSPEYPQVLVPGLIALGTASGALQGIGSNVSYMRTYGAWRTLRGSPIPMPLYLSGLVLGRMLRALAGAAFLMLVARAACGYRFAGSVTLALFHVALGVAIFGALGLVVTYLVATPQAVTSVLNVIFLAMAFSSNTLFIAEVGWLRALSYLSPLTFLCRLLRDGASADESLARWATSMTVLVVWLMVCSWWALRLARRKVEEA